jgi:hypothetical protein
MTNEQIKQLQQKLLDQYYSKNDKLKTHCNEEYIYKLIENEFDEIMRAFMLSIEITTL